MRDKRKDKLSLSVKIVLTSLFLCLFGVLVTYSASALKSNALFGTPYHFVYKQSLGVFFGFFLIFLIRKTPISLFSRVPLPFFCLTSILLALIFVPGAYHTAGGASRWINLWFLRVQPSELAKLSLIFLLAKNLSRKSFSIRSFRSVYLGHALILSFLSYCLMKQPDFGSTFLIFAITFFMLFVSGLKLKHMLISAFVTLPVLFWAILSEPYRAKRIFSFLNPWGNIEGGGFQIIQSYLAFSNGSFFGVGFGNSKQKLFYLPEAHTDFILSVLAEELGFIGVLFVLILFVYLISLGLSITKVCQEPYKKLLAFGLTSFLGLQAVINIAVVFGLLPTKGSSLPFISSGVSSLLTCLLCVGVLSRIALDVDSKKNAP